MPKKNKYNVEAMESAINEVRNNNMSYRNAADKYGVPKSTLEFKIKNPGHKDTCGPSPILSLREEAELVKWIEGVASKGFPRKKDDILNSVQKFLTDNPRPNPFKNNRPGDSWLKAFLRRHPTIVQRTSESVSAASACVSESDIRKWFKDINSYLVSKNLNIDDPSRIYNGDESGFQICPETGKVFAGKGAKNVYSVEKGSPKENITVMFSFSASGLTCPPMIVYPYKRIPEKNSMSVNPNWGIGRSDNGWMTSETFFDYVKNIFYPFLVENNIQFPVILYLDGHKSHLTYELSLLCNELNIEVIALYPNATRILQPCDVAVFRPIKMGWKKAVREFYEQNPGVVLSKITFAPLLEKVIKNSIKADTLIHGFRACGLFPFNSDAVDYTKCLGKKNKPTDEVKIPPPRMDHNKFVSLAGETLINRFKLFDELLINEGITNEFLTLYNIWNYFEKPDSLPSEKNEDVSMPEVLESLDNQLLNSASDTELNLSEHLPQNESTVNVIQDIVIKQPNRVTNYSLPSTSKSIDNQLLNSASDTKLNLSEHPPQNESTVNVIQDIVIKQPNRVTNYSLPSTSKSIDIYLVEPETPARKNKRNIERVSFAVTSRNYQENFERKRALKLEAENKKLERKQKRKDNAAAKALKKNAIRSGNNKNSCFVCKVRTIKNNYLTCDSCKKRIHRRCVPKNYDEHIPEEGDDDLFMCHICYRTEESDEYEDFELESEDEGSEIDDRKEIYSEISEESKENLKKMEIVKNSDSENNNIKERTETKCKNKSKEIEDNSTNLKQYVERTLEKKQKVVMERVEKYNIFNKKDIEEKTEEEKRRSNQNPDIVKDRVLYISETKSESDDDMEIDELFNMYQTEIKQYK